MRKIRVLVVDDSPLARKLITSALEESGDIEVAGCAMDGYSAGAQVAALRPDVMTLDIGMPGMDGITFLRKSKRESWVPAVVISSMTGASCNTALEALRAGAVEVIAKPADKQGFLDFRALLPGKVRAACACRRSSPAPVRDSFRVALRMDTPAIIAIGSSTGGTEAVEKILRQAAEDCPGIVIAQHIPAKFSQMFAERLQQVCRIHVKEAEDGDLVCPGLALIAPGDQHLIIRKRLPGLEVTVEQGPRVSFQRPSVNKLFESVAAIAGNRALGVILTGMGTDGAAGMAQMKKAGAVTLAQDEATCAVFGMPKEAIRLGAVDHVLPIEHIAATISRLHSRAAGRAGGQ